jgi:hypothetical protein
VSTLQLDNTKRLSARLTLMTLFIDWVGKPKFLILILII